MQKEWIVTADFAVEAINVLNARHKESQNAAIQEMIDFANELEEKGFQPEIRVSKGKLKIVANEDSN